MMGRGGRMPQRLTSKPMGLPNRQRMTVQIMRLQLYRYRQGEQPQSSSLILRW